jgi:hypothetical protein
LVRVKHILPEGDVGSGDEYGYDKNGKLVSISYVLFNQYYPDGKMENLISIQYNGGGRVSETTWYNQKNEPVVCYSYTYNSSGLLTQEKSFEPDGSLRTETKLEYDRLGRLVKEMHHNYCNGEGLLEVIEYKY